MTERKVSWQVRQAWRRFGSWYGADVLERKYGLNAPQDWADVIDDIPESMIDRVMSETRSKYPTWLPSLAEFEQVVKQVKRPVVMGPTTQEQLCNFVLKNRDLTLSQVRQPWTYTYGQAGEVTGVVVPADGERCGYFVRVEDMMLGRVA